MAKTPGKKNAKDKKADASGAALLLTLPERADITCVEALHEQIATLMQQDSDAPIIIQVAETHTLTTPVVQLLLSLKQSLAAQKRDMAWDGDNEVIQNVSARLGVSW